MGCREECMYWCEMKKKGKHTSVFPRLLSKGDADIHDRATLGLYPGDVPWSSKKLLKIALYRPHI